LRDQIKQEDFDELLCWLDRDRDLAGKKYESIRQSLIKIFVWQGCTDGEELADETINRVLKKISPVKKSYVGDPALYFYGVARKILLETKRRPEREVEIDHALSLSDLSNLEDSLEKDRTESLENLLDEWLNTLTKRERDLLLNYYVDEGIARIRNRKKLGKAWKLSSAALRQRVHRLKVDFERWMRQRHDRYTP
jgi:DNA-directed RNA polymerase specialized sigma24 family protein